MRPQDLPQHKLISIRYLGGNVSRWNLRSAPGKPAEEWLPEPVAVMVSDPMATVEAAVVGLGIAQCGVHHAWPALQAGKLKVVLPRHHESGRRAMALQYPHRALMAPRVKATVDYLLEGFKRDEALTLRSSDLHAYAA
jgi:DNA-binding transcriptional LysR family regulator